MAQLMNSAHILPESITFAHAAHTRTRWPKMFNCWETSHWYLLLDLFMYLYWPRSGKNGTQRDHRWRRDGPDHKGFNYISTVFNKILFLHISVPDFMRPSRTLEPLPAPTLRLCMTLSNNLMVPPSNLTNLHHPFKLMLGLHDAFRFTPEVYGKCRLQILQDYSKRGFISHTEAKLGETWSWPPNFPANDDLLRFIMQLTKQHRPKITFNSFNQSDFWHPNNPWNASCCALNKVICLVQKRQLTGYINGFRTSTLITQMTWTWHHLHGHSRFRSLHRDFNLFPHTKLWRLGTPRLPSGSMGLSSLQHSWIRCFMIAAWRPPSPLSGAWDPWPCWLNQGRPADIPLNCDLSHCWNRRERRQWGCSTLPYSNR